MSDILLTGIEPFDGETLNPSWEAARALHGADLDGHRIVAQRLPCVIASVGAALRAAIEAMNPVLVLCLGQAGGRPDISIERVAINVIDARIPDNAGQQPVDEPVVADGPVAYFSRLPIKAMVHALRAAGLPASVSQSAGTYNCNAIFYHLMHYMATQRPDLRGGFVHVPYLPAMAASHPAAPSLALSELIAATRIMLNTALRTPQDIALGAGATH